MVHARPLDLPHDPNTFFSLSSSMPMGTKVFWELWFVKFAACDMSIRFSCNGSPMPRPLNENLVQRISLARVVDPF